MKILGAQRKTLFLLCFIAVCGVVAKENRKGGRPNGGKHHRAISKTIQTEDGDIFDCIDIKSQPAFDHPLLRNHSIQMEPSSHPIGLEGNSIPDTTLESSTHLVSCPLGTIPIWRSEQHYPIVDIKELTQQIYTRNITRDNKNNTASLAGLSRGQDIYGTTVSINVYDPEVYGTQDKSGGLTTIISGYSFDREHTNAVGVGWFVWQSNGGDKAARFHIFYDNGQKQCFDLKCPGFIHTSPNIPLGGKLSPISKYDGPQAHMNTFVYQDTNSNWWVKFGKEGTVVGYWPGELFGYLKSKGTVGYWGGLVEGPTIKYKPPPMGSGHPASEGDGTAAYVKNIKIVTRDHQLVTPMSREFDVAVENPKCYSVAHKSDQDGGVHANWGGSGDCTL
ncbi:hypothetical protein CFC21_065429 [Triticum aestivum]|uniref:Neprosin PEP catalytic domain-containing protein n=2 Tax=Triticum aestivum TaxID=4565 RepID=A0A3B6KEC2_WHEAT|nr:uncharacterized protein LOC123106910 [Triticum aestivum]KAF7058353.1 hypothetical protein CFC21_065429 [Triticum aestivum]